MEMPPGMEAQIRSKSGLSSSGIIVLNSPGTIDSDYRGYISILLMNVGKEPYAVEPRKHIAQLVFADVYSVTINVVPSPNDLKSTTRGDKGRFWFFIIR